MTWQETCDGLKAWFATLSGIAPKDIAWAGAAVGMRSALTADLSLISHASVQGDELVFAEGAGDNLAAEARGNRQRTLSCRVRSRDQRPDGKALVYCERVRDRLDLPSSQLLLEQLGIGLQGVGTVVDLSHQFDNREESASVIDLILNFAASEIAADSGIGPIEHVEVSGTVHDEATEITVPETTVPPTP
jgi:hypothetical protein